MNTKNFKLQQTLTAIQKMFYEQSEYTDGPSAGKVTPQVLRTILVDSEQFQGTNEEFDEYFALLDKDNDRFVSFQDFLGPLLPMLPQEVSKVFIEDLQFQNETHNELRIAYEDCRQEKLKVGKKCEEVRVMDLRK